MKTLAIVLLLTLPGAVFASKPGEDIFKKNCAVCHGPDGKANTPQGKQLGAANLTNSDIQNMTDSGIAGTVKYGRGVMPPFKQLTPEQVKLLVQYVRSLPKK